MDTVTLPDGRTMFLGRIPPVKILDLPQFRLLELSDGTRKMVAQLAYHYDKAEDVAPPRPSVDYSAAALESIKRVYLNDQYGDCVIASTKHRVGIWTGNESGTVALATDKEVYAEYQGICGRGDNGCDISRVLDYHRDRGMQFNGVNHKIDDYVAVDWTNRNLVEVAIDEFGAGLNIGFDLPGSWEGTKRWDVSNAGRIAGGHDVTAAGYDEEGVHFCTWGGIVLMTWPAVQSRKWITEMYVSLSPDWYAKANTTPNGVNADTLKSDLAKIKNGQVPDLLKLLDWIV